MHTLDSMLQSYTYTDIIDVCIYIYIICSLCDSSLTTIYIRSEPMNNQGGGVGNTVNNSGSSSGTKDGGLKRTGSLSTTSLSSLQASKSSSMESLESSMSISESTTGWKQRKTF